MKAITFALVPLLVVGHGPEHLPSVPIRGVQGQVALPLLGIGTWQYNDTVAENVVATAFQQGYRHVDTAVVYANAVGVGRALQKSGLRRQEYFVTSKIPIGLNITATVEGMYQNLDQLQLDYVDLMLVHIPATGRQARQEQWLALEKFAKAGKARAIGVSHHCKRQLEDVLSVASLPVAVNQVQYHVGMGSAGDGATDDKPWVESKGILYQSFSPLCGPCNATTGDNKALITGDLVTGIGRRYNKTGAQVALRWLAQQGIPVIPKTQNPNHIQQNMQIFDFMLSDVDMSALTHATVPAVGGGPGPSDSGDCGMKDENLLV